MSVLLRVKWCSMRKAGCAVDKPTNPIPAYVKRGDVVTFTYKDKPRVVLVQAVFRQGPKQEVYLRGLELPERSSKVFNGHIATSWNNITRGDKHVVS